MTNYLLVNIDSKIPNLALAKIEKYHQDRGDNILWDLPIYKSIADMIYVSCLFTWNRSACLEWVSSKTEICYNLCNVSTSFACLCVVLVNAVSNRR